MLKAFKALENCLNDQNDQDQSHQNDQNDPTDDWKSWPLYTYLINDSLKDKLQTLNPQIRGQKFDNIQSLAR